MAGALIRTFRARSGPGEKLQWDLLSPGGTPLSDGVYVALLRSSSADPHLQDRRVIKFVVARRH
jgi:hypothetical protein